MSDSTPAQRAPHRAAWPWLLLAYVLAYGRSLGFGLVWDDQILARGGAFHGSLWKMLVSPQQALMDEASLGVVGAEQTYSSYRPLQTLSHVIDLRVLGGSPLAMHAHNVALGALCVLLAYAVLLRVLPRRTYAIVAAAVFALHPLQAETVAYVSARGDLLAGAFALLSVWACLVAGDASRATQRWSLAVGAALAFFASLLAKEAYAAVPAIVLLLAWAKRGVRVQVPVLAMQAVALVAYVALRSAVVGEVSAKLGASPLSALSRWPGVTLQYAWAFVAPLNLSIGRPLLTSFTPPGWLGFGVFVVAAVVARRTPARRRVLGPLLIGTSCVALLLGPAAVAAVDTGVVADRYAYLAVIPMTHLVLCGYDVVERARLRRLLQASAAVWALALLFVSTRQVGAFHDNWSLYLHDASQQPQSAVSQYRVGYLAARAGDLQRARTWLERAIELDPRFAKARNNLGVVLMQMGALEQAEQQLREAIALMPRLNYRAWYNLAMVQGQRGNVAGACEALAHASAINPAYAKATQARAAMCGSQSRPAAPAGRAD